MDYEKEWEEIGKRENEIRENLVTNPLKFFISYSTEDSNKLAGLLREILMSFGFTVFLAHEDIPAGKHGGKEMLDNLMSCDIFVPILTEGFPKSKYCDQETGVALALKKKIIPMKVSVTPYGFVKDIEATKLNKGYVLNPPEGYAESEINIRKTNREYLMENVRELAEVLGGPPEYRDRTLNSLIDGVCNSSSYQDAGDKMEMIKRFDFFDGRQLNKLALGAIENSQVGDSYRAQNVLREIFSKNKNKIHELFIGSLKDSRLLE